MKLRDIYVENFLGVTQIDLQALPPVVLVCGPNAAGKSSLRDAVALALTADLGRVSLKKDAPALVRGDAKAAVCEVVDADGDKYNVSITSGGKISDSQKGRDTDPAMPLSLDGQRFARMSDTERRTFLYDLMGVKMDQGDIARRLEERGCHIGKVQRVLPLLRSGFTAAHDQAKASATEAKGAWRGVTGENYGPDKALGWKASMPKFDEARHKELLTAVEQADHAIGQWQVSVGQLQAVHQQRESLRAKLPALEEQIGRIARAEAKLAADRKSLGEWEEDLAKTTAAAGAGPRVGLVHDLAAALNGIVLSAATIEPGLIAAADMALSAYEKEHGTLDPNAAGDEGARARLPQVKTSRDLMQRAVANAERDLQALQAAKTEHARITEELAQAFDPKELEAAKEQIASIQASRAKAQAELDTLSSLKAAAESAERKTKEATEHAAAVREWTAIAEALSPDGIPAEILAEALGPINSRLAQSAADAQWPQVTIGDDMAITAAGRAYGMLSESERWRCDAMLAEAIAHLSGVRLLVLDRADVLDMQGRSDLLAWLDVLADTGEVDTALVFMTLKSMPTGLPPTTTAYWVDGGTVKHYQEAA